VDDAPEATAASAAHRPQEPKAVVVPKRLYRDARQFRELVHSIRGHVWMKCQPFPRGRVNSVAG